MERGEGGCGGVGGVGNVAFSSAVCLWSVLGLCSFGVPDLLVFFSGLGFGGVGGVGGLVTSRSPPLDVRSAAAQGFLGSMTSETCLCWLSCVLAWLAALRRSGCIYTCICLYVHVYLCVYISAHVSVQVYARV